MPIDLSNIRRTQLANTMACMCFAFDISTVAGDTDGWTSVIPTTPQATTKPSGGANTGHIIDDDGLSTSVSNYIYIVRTIHEIFGFSVFGRDNGRVERSRVVFRTHIRRVLSAHGIGRTTFSLHYNIGGAVRVCHPPG